MIRATMIVSLCVCLSSLLVAQRVAAPAATAANQQDSPPAQPSPPMPLAVTLPRDTEIDLVTLEPVSSATATKGQPVRLAVAKDFVINGVVAIAKGTPGMGEVSRLTKGIPGKQDGFIRVIPTGLSLADGTAIKLKEFRTGEDDCGDMGPCWAMAIFAALFSPAILIKKFSEKEKNPPETPQGKDQTLGAGYPVEGFAAHRTVIRKITP